MSEKTLKPKHAKFVQEYVKGVGQKQAAIAAGYSVKSASSTARDLLKVAAIQEAIAEAQEAAERAANYSVKEAMDSLKEIIERAQAKGNLVVELRTREMMSRVAGHLTEKLEIKNTHTIDLSSVLKAADSRVKPILDAKQVALLTEDVSALPARISNESPESIDLEAAFPSPEDGWNRSWMHYRGKK